MQRDFSLRSVAKSIKSNKCIKVLVVSGLTAFTIPSMPMQHRSRPHVLSGSRLLLRGTIAEWIRVARIRHARERNQYMTLLGESFAEKYMQSTCFYLVFKIRCLLWKEKRLSDIAAIVSHSC
jgi:hypothetical protein